MGDIELYDWFLGAAGWPGLAGAAGLGHKHGAATFYFLENNCLSPNWCQWYWNIWIYFCGTSKTEDKQKRRKYSNLKNMKDCFACYGSSSNVAYGYILKIDSWAVWD